MRKIRNRMNLIRILKVMTTKNKFFLLLIKFGREHSTTT